MFGSPPTRAFFPDGFGVDFQLHLIVDYRSVLVVGWFGRRQLYCFGYVGDSLLISL